MTVREHEDTPDPAAPAGAPRMDAFGVLLRRYRLSSGLTQEELAERAGVGVRNIGDMERGAPHIPRKDTVALLAAALHLAPPEGDRFQQAAQWAGRSAAPAVPPGLAVSLPSVGRTSELALLERHLAGITTDAAPPVLLLAGEPGIGKTHLLHAAVPLAIGQGWRVLEGGCTRHGDQEPYAPLLGALHSYIARLPPAQRRADLQGCAWLVRLLPELADLGIDLLPAWAVPPAQERRLMFAAVARFLANVGGQASARPRQASDGIRGVLLLLDDLQWAGPDALDLLATLARSSAEAPLRIIGAYRDTEVHSQDPLSVLLADLAHAGLATRRLLRPLTAQQAEQLLDELWEAQGGQESALRAKVLQRAGGVPFFLVSCAQVLQQDDHEEDRAESIPWDVAHSVRQRVATLPEEARAVLEVAAVVGRVVPHVLLISAIAQPEDTVVAALDAACRARLLEEHGQELYRFTHDVIWEVIVQDLGAARRAALHRRVAETLEQTPGEAPLERLAYHFVQAMLRDKAALYLERAGDRARAQYANAAAAADYREAIEALEHLGRLVDAARVCEKWGAVLRTMGHHNDTLAVFEQSIAAYQDAGDLESVARTLAETWLLYIERGAADEGIRRYQTVIDLLEARGPSPGLAALYAGLGVLFSTSERYAEYLALADRAVALACGSDDVELLAEAEIKRGHALIYMVGHVTEGMRSLEKVISLGEAAGGMTNLAGWYNTLTGTCLERGELATARRLNQRGYEIAEQQGNLLRLVNSTFSRANIAFYTGDWEHAHADYIWACDTSRQIGASRTLLGALGGLGELLLARGKEEAASVQLDDAVAIATQTNNVGALRAASLVLAERDILVGRPEAACARLLAMRAHSDPRERYIDDLPVWLAWAKAEMGEWAEASTLIAQAITFIRADTRQLALVGALRVQALVAMGQACWTEAESALAEGLSVARAIGHPYAEARLLHAQGVLHGQRGMSEESRTPLQAALVIFRRLGAAGDAVRVEQALGAVESAASRAAGSLHMLSSQDASPALGNGSPAGGRLTRNGRQAWALDYLRTTGPLSPGTYAQALGVSADTAFLDLRELVARGLVRAEGATRHRRYLLAGDGRT